MARKSYFAKSISLVLCLAMLVLLLPLTAISASGTTMVFTIGEDTYTINGTETQMDVSPVIIEERTMLPVRFVAEPLGAAVKWEGTTQKVTVQLMDTILELWIGQSNAMINGVTTPIDPDNPNVKPLLINDRTMLPLRFVTENLGCEVKWEDATKQVTITKGVGETDETDETDETPGTDDEDSGNEDDDEEIEDNGDDEDIADDGSESGDDSDDEATINKKPFPGSIVDYIPKESIATKEPITIIPDSGDPVFNNKFPPYVFNPNIFGVIEMADGPQTVTMADKTEIPTIMEIGRGYNVFGIYASSISLVNAVLDTDKLIQDGQIQHSGLGTARFLEAEGASLEEYAEDITTSAKLGGGFMGFGASISTSFASSYRSVSTSYYNTISWVIMEDTLFIKGSCNYKDYVLPDVKAILDTGSYNGQNFTPAQIFDAYGGYVLVNGIFGGRIEYSVAAESEYCTSYKNFKANVKAGFNAGVGSISAELKHESTTNETSYRQHSSTSVITYGGLAQDGNRLSAEKQKVSALQEWRDSVSDRPVWVDFGETNALVPIWELCSDGQRASMLKLAFTIYSMGKQPVFPKKTAIAYDNYNFLGNSKIFNLGNYGTMGTFSNKISSIRVEPGYTVRAYEDINFQGRFRIYVGGYEYPSLDSGMNNNIASMIIEESNESNKIVATIYQHKNYGGNYQDLTLGNYPNMKSFFVGNDSVSSIKVAPGYKILLYEDVDFKGKCVEYTGNYYSISFSDKTSSIKVVKK